MIEDYILTLNAMGYMTKTLDFVQNAFVAFARAHPDQSFLDIGCAFGNTVLPLVSEGIRVTACDLDGRHLAHLHAHCPKPKRSLLHCHEGHFPREISFPKESFSGILMAMVLHFLREEEVHLAFQAIAHSLKKGGKLFLTASSPYQGVLKSFLPIYEARKNTGNVFPGKIDDISLYVPHRKKDLPRQNIVYSYDEIERFCHKADLWVEQSGFFSRVLMPCDIRLDGREYAYVIACK